MAKINEIRMLVRSKTHRLDGRSPTIFEFEEIVQLADLIFKHDTKISKKEDEKINREIKILDKYCEDEASVSIRTFFF